MFLIILITLGLMFIIIKQFSIFSIFWSNIKLDFIFNSKYKLDFNARVFVFRNDCVTRVNRWFVSRVRDLCTWNMSKHFQLFDVQSSIFLLQNIFSENYLLKKTSKIPKFKMFQVKKFWKCFLMIYKQNLMFKIHGKNSFAEVSKNLYTDLRIILLDQQNNYVEFKHWWQCCKKL